MRSSRRPKLDSYSTSFLVHVAREWLFELHYQSFSFMKKVLANAAQRGDAEACWLQARILAQDPPLVESGNGLKQWLREVFLPADEEKSCFWAFYASKTIAAYDRQSALALELMEACAKRGFSPAMCEMASRCQGNLDEGAAKEWLRRAMEKRDGKAFVMMARMDYDNHFQHLHRAALCEDLTGMRMVSSHYSDQLPPMEASKFGARFVAFTAFPNTLLPGYFVRVSKEGQIEKNVTGLQQPFAIGRELEGYDQFWDPGTRPAERDLLCVEVYLTTTHNARRAALQTVAMLMENKFPRDVAKLIAKMVYATREDTTLWFR